MSKIETVTSGVDQSGRLLHDDELDVSGGFGFVERGIFIIGGKMEPADLRVLGYDPNDVN
jgi:hypothetical protein